MFDSTRRTKRAQALLWCRPGASWDRPGEAFGCFPADLGLPRTSQDRPRGSIWASWTISCPERIRTRPRNGRGRPKRFKIDFSSILGRSGADFRRISNNFASICARAACDEGTKAESQKGAVRSSALVLALALWTRFVLLAHLSQYLSSIAYSAFFVAYPQAHLVYY